MIYVEFHHAPKHITGPTAGPFESVRLIYHDLWADRPMEEPILLAVQSISGMWDTSDGGEYTDVVIYSREEEPSVG